MNPMLRDDSAPDINCVQRCELRQWFGRYPICLALLSLSLMASPAWGGTQIQWPIGNTAFQSYWPADSAWTKINALNDGDDGLTDTVLEFVGDTTNSGFYVAKVSGPSNIKYLLFRIRVQYDGTVTQPSETAPVAPFNTGTILVLIQKGTTDDLVKQPQWGFSWDFQSNTAADHGMEMQVLSSQGGSGSAWKNTKMDDVDGNGSAKNVPDFDNATRGGMSGTDAYIRTVDGQSTTIFGTTTFVDFAISCDYLTYVSDYTKQVGWTGAKVDLACGDNLYFQIGSISASNDHGFLAYDIGAGQAPASIVPTSTEKLPAGPIATYALVSSFDASVRNGRVVVEWDTQVEAGTLGFELDRQNALGEFEPVHKGLISGYGPAGEGGTYRFVDPSALPGFLYTYRLTEVEANGNRREVGQYVVTPEAKAGKVSAASAPMQLFVGEATFTPRKPNAAEKARLAARRAERAAVRENRLETGATAMAASSAAQSLAANGARVTEKAVIGVKEAGLYYVSAAQLEETLAWPAGKATRLIRTEQLRLTNQGQDIAWRPARRAEGFYFYGEASRSIYDPENVYVVQRGPGTRMANTTVRATGPVGADSFPATVTAEENRFAATVLAKATEEDYWHWASFKAGGIECQSEFLACGVRKFTLAAPDAAASGLGHLLVALRGASSLPQSLDHRITVSLNGTPIGEGQWDGLTDHTLVLPFDQSLLKSGTQSVRVEAQLDPGVAYNYFYVDRFELSYQRRYQALQDALQASGASGQLLRASGFSSDMISVFDLTDPKRPKLVSGAKVQGAPGSYELAFVPPASTTPYLLLTTSAIRSPVSMRAMQATGLAGRNAGVQYVVLAPEDFADGAQRLVDFRVSQGLSGRFVPLQAIYDQYGGGEKTPHAVRKFLANALRNWETRPHYVVLGGKGTYDPKDYLGYGTDRLPVLMALTEAGVIAADQRFVDRDGNGLGDIPIGRLPAATAAEFDAMVSKIIGYENATADRSRRVVLLADGPDTGGNYTADSEAMAEQLLQAGYLENDIHKLYLEKMPASTIRDNLLDALNSGVRLLNYFGHSGVTGLDHGLLSTAGAATLTNGRRLPVMAGMTCYMNRFEYPAMTTLGESLLLNPQGGAVAVWSSGGTSYNSEARQLDDGLFKALFESQEDRLGSAVVSAVSRHVKAGGDATVPRIYNLLGDPATKW